MHGSATVPRAPTVSRSGVFVSRVGPGAYAFRFGFLLLGTVFLMLAGDALARWMELFGVP